MNKKIFAVLVAVAVTAAAAFSAEARDGFYLGIKGGGANNNMNSNKDSAFDSNRVDFDNVWFMSGAFGYRWNYLRAELEYTYRNDFDDKIPFGAGLDPNTYFSKTVLKSKSVMANAYLDFMPNYVVSPYLSGGIGMTFLELENTVNTAGGAQPTDSYDETNFTWSLGAGLTIRLNKCINIDGGYRYVDMGSIGKANLNVHEVYGGLRYTF